MRCMAGLFEEGQWLLWEITESQRGQYTWDRPGESEVAGTSNDWITSLTTWPYCSDHITLKPYFSQCKWGLMPLLLLLGHEESGSGSKEKTGVVERTLRKVTLWIHSPLPKPAYQTFSTWKHPERTDIWSGQNIITPKEHIGDPTGAARLKESSGGNGIEIRKFDPLGGL